MGKELRGVPAGGRSPGNSSTSSGKSGNNF